MGNAVVVKTFFKAFQEMNEPNQNLDTNHFNIYLNPAMYKETYTLSIKTSTYFSSNGGTISSGLIADRCFKASEESPLPYLLNMEVKIVSFMLSTNRVMSFSVNLWLSGTCFHHRGFWYLSLKMVQKHLKWFLMNGFIKHVPNNDSDLTVQSKSWLVIRRNKAWNVNMQIKQIEDIQIFEYDFYFIDWREKMYISSVANLYKYNFWNYALYFSSIFLDFIKLYMNKSSFVQTICFQ